MIKRTVCLILTVTMLAALGCAPAPDSAESSTAPVMLADKGIELIKKVDKLAECREFTEMYTANSEMREIIQAIGAGDYSEPSGIFVIENPDEAVLKGVMAEIKLPADIADMLQGRFAAAIPSQLTSMNGAQSLAAVSILSYGESFLSEDVTAPVSYIYTYGGDYCFMVTYIPYEDGVVSASVSTIINGGLSKCASTEDVKAFLSDALPYEEVSVSMATKEK